MAGAPVYTNRTRLPQESAYISNQVPKKRPEEAVCGLLRNRIQTLGVKDYCKRNWIVTVRCIGTVLPFRVAG